MPKHTRTPVLLLLTFLLAACNWPLSHPETESLAVGTAPSMEIQPTGAEGGGRQNRNSSAATSPAMAFVSPLATPGQTAPPPTPVTVLGHEGLFSGRRLRFDLPEGYHTLEGLDGGCFLYPAPGGAAESLPGFLVLYPEAGESGEMLAELLNATTGLRRTESPLEVDIGGLTFVGLFVETNDVSRLFLAAADGWILVAQGLVEDWPALASELNQVLMSLSFKEGF
jgi:hypothetical protein